MKKNFDLFMSQLAETNATLDFYTDFSKIRENVRSIEIKLNTLNYLIGKDDLAAAVKELWDNDKRVFSILDILIATRQEQHKKYLDDMGKAHLVHELLDSYEGVIKFLNETGLSDVLKNKDIKNQINYRDGDPGWLKCSLLGSTDSDTWIYSASADPNKKPTDRTADIFITATTMNGTLLNGVLSVSQGANTAPLETDPKLIAYCKDVSLSAEGEPLQVFVETDVERLSCGKTASWITVSYDQKNSKINIGATKNDQEEARSGMVILTAKNEYSTKKDTIRVNQLGTIDVSKHKVLFTDMTVHAVIPYDGFEAHQYFNYKSYLEFEFPIDSANISVLESKLITEEGYRPIYSVKASGHSANGHNYNINFDCTLIENGLDDLHDTLVFSDIRGYIDYGPSGDKELAYSFIFHSPPARDQRHWIAYHMNNDPLPDDSLMYRRSLLNKSFCWEKYWQRGCETLYNWELEDLYPYFHASYYYRNEDYPELNGIRELPIGVRNANCINGTGKCHRFSIIVHYKKNEKIE